MDTSTVEDEDLGKLLRTFYCEMSPRDAEKRSEQMGRVGKFYHKNTIKNIRSALNRHLSDIGRRIDIVHDKDFKSANNTLDGFLKEQTRSGNSRATTHKAIIEKDDIDKNAEYFRYIIVWTGNYHRPWSDAACYVQRLISAYNICH